LEADGARDREDREGAGSGGQIEDVRIERASERATLDRVFHRERCREPVPERRRVGENLGDAVGAELGREGQVVGVEVEEGGDAAGGERAELTKARSRAVPVSEIDVVSCDGSPSAPIGPPPVR
jgi:hypothetical protein